jgi:hypothetical protein
MHPSCWRCYSGRRAGDAHAPTPTPCTGVPLYDRSNSPQSATTLLDCWTVNALVDSPYRHADFDLKHPNCERVFFSLRGRLTRSLSYHVRCHIRLTDCRWVRCRRPAANVRSDCATSDSRSSTIVNCALSFVAEAIANTATSRPAPPARSIDSIPAVTGANSPVRSAPFTSTRPPNTGNMPRACRRPGPAGRRGLTLRQERPMRPRPQRQRCQGANRTPNQGHSTLPARRHRQATVRHADRSLYLHTGLELRRGPRGRAESTVRRPTASARSQH